MQLKQASVLPHGYLKRLELARLIALKSEVFILDELFSGLSIAEVTSIVPIIEKILSEGHTVIMVEHRLKELFRIADKVIVLSQGIKVQRLGDDPLGNVAHVGCLVSDLARSQLFV
jgi:ABC-type branched-subunit amino acid transport system ATPase component